VITTLGQVLNGTSQADVANPIPSRPTTYIFTGGLAPGPGNGPNAALGYTGSNRPTFSGTANPFAVVELFARRSDVDAVLPLGRAVASGSGAWTMATGPLSNGSFLVTAVVTPPGGYPSPMLPLANSGRVVIDTLDPKFVSVRPLKGGAKVDVYLSDLLSGIDMKNLNNKLNYTFVGPGLPSLHPSDMEVISSGNLPTGTIGVRLTISAKPREGGLIRAIRISGTNLVPDPQGGLVNMGIIDNSGNALQGGSRVSLTSTEGRAADSPQSPHRRR
jgi:hypothetical protein